MTITRAPSADPDFAFACSVPACGTETDGGIIDHLGHVAHYLCAACLRRFVATSGAAEDNE